MKYITLMIAFFSISFQVNASFTNKWEYSESTSSAGYFVNGNIMASVDEVEGKPFFSITDLSGMVGCGFENNPEPSFIDVTVNGTEGGKMYSFCRTYQRVYVAPSVEHNNWFISNLYQGNTITLKLGKTGYTFKITSDGFRKAVVNNISSG